VQETQRAECRVQEGSVAFAEARSAERVAILVPPAVLHEMQAVLDFPVPANPSLQLARRHGVRIETRDEVATLARKNVALGRNDCALDANENLAVDDS